MLGYDDVGLDIALKLSLTGIGSIEPHAFVSPRATFYIPMLGDVNSSLKTATFDASLNVLFSYDIKERDRARFLVLYSLKYSLSILQ